LITSSCSDTLSNDSKDLSERQAQIAIYHDFIREAIEKHGKLKVPDLKTYKHSTDKPQKESKVMAALEKMVKATVLPEVVRPKQHRAITPIHEERSESYNRSVGNSSNEFESPKKYKPMEIDKLAQKLRRRPKPRTYGEFNKDGVYAEFHSSMGSEMQEYSMHGHQVEENGYVNVLEDHEPGYRTQYGFN